MAQHLVVPLEVIFTKYTIRQSSSGGKYYVFEVINDKQVKTICRMDSIHVSQITHIIEALDKGEPITAPVFVDKSGFYRIDLTALHDKKNRISGKPSSPPKREMPPVKIIKPGTRIAGTPVQKEKEAQQEKILDETPRRAQFSITSRQYAAMKSLAEAEGYQNYADWLRALVSRVLTAAASVEEVKS